MKTTTPTPALTGRRRGGATQLGPSVVRSLIAALAACTGIARADEVRADERSALEVVADSSERGVLGLRGSYSATNTGRQRDSGGGLVLTGFGDAFRGRGPWSARASHLFSLGGGTAGVEGSIGGLLALGLRIPIGTRGGAFLRGAARGELLGNSLFWFSRLQLPEGQLGYQFASANVRFEAGVTVAPVLAGRLRIAELASRNLGEMVATGGFVTLQTAGVSASLDAARLSDDGSIRTNSTRAAQATLCGRSAPVALCGDVRFVESDAPGAPTARVFQGGLTFALARP